MVIRNQPTTNKKIKKPTAPNPQKIARKCKLAIALNLKKLDSIAA